MSRDDDKKKYKNFSGDCWLCQGCEAFIDDVTWINNTIDGDGYCDECYDKIVMERKRNEREDYRRG